MLQCTSTPGEDRIGHHGRSGLYKADDTHGAFQKIPTFCNPAYMNREYTKIEMLALTDLLREEVIRRMIDSLSISSGGIILDAGCGTGSCIDILAKNAGADTRMIGIDLDIDSLRSARNRPNGKDAAYIRGSLTRLPFADETFDWALSVDCVGMIPYSASRMITELVRVVKPGGTLALASWTSQQLLPGHPRLEAHLNTTARGIAPFQDELPPSLHFLRLKGQLDTAGLIDICICSFLGDIHPPRNDTEKRALDSLFFMRWGRDPGELPDEERRLYRSLIDPESDRCIYRQPDYYAWFIYTLFAAQKPGK